MGKEREKGSSNHTHTIHSIHIQPQGQGGVYTTNTNERKARNTKTRTQTDRKERMSLMTLFAGPTTMHSTHLDRSLHDLMFAPTSCRSRCGSGSLARRAGGGARMDVIEHSDKSDLVVDAPGLTPADIHVKLEDGVLSVEGKHEVHETKEDSGGKVIYSERRRSSFSRRFALPDDADESSIHAKQKDGVVTISIGKAAPSAPRIRHIPVSSLADGSGVPPSPHADAAGAAGPGETPQQHDGDTAHADA